MANITSIPLTALTVGLAIALTGAVVACSDDAANTLGNRPGSSGNASGGTSSGDGGSSGNPSGPPQEEVLFRAVESDFKQKCGKTCHEEGTTKPAPPTFLAPPDAYKSIKGYNGVVVADYYQSIVLTKGAHAGPAIGDDPTFEQKVIDWLKYESAIIQSQKKPSIDAVTLKSGANDIDMSKASTAARLGVLHVRGLVALRFRGRQGPDRGREARARQGDGHRKTEGLQGCTWLHRERPALAARRRRLRPDLLELPRQRSRPRRAFAERRGSDAGLQPGDVEAQ